MARNSAEVAHGPMMIGIFLNVLLYGIMVMQVLVYWGMKRRDRTWMRWMVAFLFFADTLHTVFAFVYIYNSLITQHGNEQALANSDWIFGTDPGLTGIIAMVVQLFFGWRVKILTGKTWISLVIYVTAVISGLAAVGAAIGSGIIVQYVNFQRMQVIVIIWLAGETVCDLMITASLAWYLRKHKGRFSSTDQIIDKLIRLTVQTGAITSLAAIADLLLFLLEANGDHLLVNFALAKLYSNSLMSSLNARRGWSSDESAATTSSSGIVSGNHISTKGDGQQFQLGSRLGTGVQITVESHEMRDMPNEHVGRDGKAASEWTQDEYEQDSKYTRKDITDGQV